MDLGEADGMPIKLLRYIAMAALGGLLVLLLALHAPGWLIIVLGALGGVGMAVELWRHRKQKGRAESRPSA